jgi:hypothetical protein
MKAATLQALKTALQATLDYSSTEWQVSFSENFENNSGQWPVNVQEDADAKINYEFADGKYLWDAKANKPLMKSVDLPNTSCRDFDFSAETRQVTGTMNADYGLVFRKDSNENFYYFATNQLMRYRLRRFYNGEWTDLIRWAVSPAVQIEKIKRLEVFAEGDHIILFINNQFVGDVHDDSIPEGACALAASLPAADQAVFEFDNIEVRIPQ